MCYLFFCFVLTMFYTLLKINLQRTLWPLKRKVFSYSRMLVNNCKHLINFIVEQFFVILYKKKKKRKKNITRHAKACRKSLKISDTHTHARHNFNLRQRCKTQYQSLSTCARKIVLISALSNSLKKKSKNRIKPDANQSQLSVFGGIMT